MIQYRYEEPSYSRGGQRSVNYQARRGTRKGEGDLEVSRREQRLRGICRSPRYEARSILNAIVRSKGDKTTYVGHEVENCQDFSSLHYRLPFEKVGPFAMCLQRMRTMSEPVGLCRRLGRTESHLG